MSADAQMAHVAEEEDVGGGVGDLIKRRPRMAAEGHPREMRGTRARRILFSVFSNSLLHFDCIDVVVDEDFTSFVLQY